ncbi:MAG: hypothetical protein JOY82_07675 [Streptosporangiaceae bacterium]|nr:hypothetical protein [Streptosporangiaceae bacterium]MBV9854392.1 hypothetical protein [Streptosporangiaceae bacterium]
MAGTSTGRRADAGMVRLSQRDIDGLMLCAEHAGAPYDLLAAALTAQPARVRAIVARWRHAGYAATGRLGPGPAWCWLTAAGMTAAGLRYPAGRPPLARLEHLRAVLAARLWWQATPAWQQGRPWWQSERRIRAVGPAAGTGHRPDAEIHWPSLTASPYAGQIWAIEVELTAKHAARTTAIMTALTAGAGYAQVIYLTAPAARRVAERCAAAMPPGTVSVWDLPPSAYTPET